MRTLKLFCLLISLLSFCASLVFSSPKIAVMDLSLDGGINHSIIEPATETIMQEFVTSKKYIVLDRNYIDQILEEQKFQFSGLVNEKQAVEVGQYLGADYIVAGKIQLVDGIYFLVAKMMEVKTGGIIGQASGQKEGKLIVCIEAAREIGKQLCGLAATKAEKNKGSNNTDSQTRTAKPKIARIITIAGSGKWESSGDGGLASKAAVKNPNGIVIDAEGNILFSDSNGHCIRQIDKNNYINRFAGTGISGLSGDGSPAINAQFAFPQGLAFDKAENLYIADSNNSLIRKIDIHCKISTFAGGSTQSYDGDGGPAVGSGLNFPAALAFDNDGNLYVADTLNNRIRKIDPAGTISTVAGTGKDGYSGDGGNASAAQLFEPEGIAIDTEGNIYIADTQNHRIRKIDNANIISTIAGSGKAGFAGDDDFATAARLNQPKGLTVDDMGNLFIADTGNCCIRKIDTSGIIKTVAGIGGESGILEGDGGPAIHAKLVNPVSVAVDSAGNIYIGDGCNAIRKVCY